jgi:hypothetical protein
MLEGCSVHRSLDNEVVSLAVAVESRAADGDEFALMWIVGFDAEEQRR